MKKLKFKNFLCCSFIFITTACVSPYFSTKAGKILRRCNGTELVGVSTDIPKAYRKTIFDGFEYWNKVTNIPLFHAFLDHDYNPYDHESDGYVSVGISNTEESKRSFCAVTKFYHNDDGCLLTTKVFINPKCLDGDLDFLSTAIRHETGHVLGLAHSFDPRRLMTSASGPRIVHPINASDDEIQNVLKLYGENSE